VDGVYRRRGAVGHVQGASDVKLPPLELFQKIFEERIGLPDVGVKKDQHVASCPPAAQVSLAGRGRRPDQEFDVGKPLHHRDNAVFRSAVDDYDFVRHYCLFGYLGEQRTDMILLVHGANNDAYLARAV
jgi:hypothetical protein